MGNLPNNQVICKCLDLLELGDERDKTLDFRVQKLTTARFTKLMIEAQLKQHGSYEIIAEHLRSSDTLQQSVNLESISASQLSRKLRAVHYTYCKKLFLRAMERIQQLTRHKNGLPNLGRLRVVDSTELILPAVVGRWAYRSKTRNAVKIHTRIVVADEQTVFPDRIIASTADVADSEVVMELVAEDDAIYVMDRGYIVYRNYEKWVDYNIRFVGRIQNRNRTTVIEERKVPENSGVLRDADVIVTYSDDEKNKVDVKLRLVEFTDDKRKFYRILTNVQDLSAEQIAEIYRHRWKIELFFKWMKQHLKLVKLYSYQEEAVWTQIFLALTAYALVLIIKLETGARQSAWDVLKLLRLYGERRWETFLQKLFRKPTRQSKGRQKKKKRGPQPKTPKRPKFERRIVR
jgi:hypothetical protein